MSGTVKIGNAAWNDGDALLAADLLATFGSNIMLPIPNISELIDAQVTDTTYAASADINADILGRNITINSAVTMTSRVKHLTIICNTFTINSTGVLNATGSGAPGNTTVAGSPAADGATGGPGGGWNDNGGAGGPGGASDLFPTGGLGGVSTGDSAGKAAAFGISVNGRRFFIYREKSWGSGGGAGAAGSSPAVPGTAGAGAITIICKSFVLNGTIKSNGTAGTAGNHSAGAGAGAPGVVTIIAGTTTGSGTIQSMGANGGNGDSTGGFNAAGGAASNGGYILIITKTGANPYTCTVTAGTGGTGAGRSAGQDGNAGQVDFYTV